MSPERALLLALGERLAYRDDHLRRLTDAVRDAPDRAADVEALAIVTAAATMRIAAAFEHPVWPRVIGNVLDRLTQPRDVPGTNGQTLPMAAPLPPEAGRPTVKQLEDTYAALDEAFNAPPPPAEPDEAALLKFHAILGPEVPIENVRTAWRFCEARMGAPAPIPTDLIARAREIANMPIYSTIDVSKRADASWLLVNALAALSPQENAP